MQEKEDDRMPTRTQMIDGLFAPERNYQTQEKVQTYIFLQLKFDDKYFNFYSSAVAVSADALRFYLSEANRIVLYIDKQNPRNYYFDFHNN